MENQIFTTCHKKVKRLAHQTKKHGKKLSKIVNIFKL